MKTLNIFQRWKLRSLVAAARTDDAIAFLRAKGLSKGESAIALAKAGMEPGAAKLAVHASPAWRDRHAADTAVHESLERAVDGLQAGRDASPEQTRFKQFEAVRLLVPRPDLDLAAGAHGVVVDVYTEPRLGYHVEFLDSTGHTLAVEIMYPNELGPA